MNLIDLEIAARTLFGEARGEPLEGQQAVASVLFNRRADGRWGASLLSVCLWKEQFSCWASGLAGTAARADFLAMCQRDDADPVLESMRSLIRACNLGEPDPTSGATHYYKAGTPTPSWVFGAVFCGEHGSQLFYKGVS